MTFTGLGTPTVTYGTFDTSSSGNYPVTCPSSFASTNSNVRTINLNASTLSFGGFISFNTQTNLTFNAGTSQINGTGTNAGLAVQTGTTFYNVAFTSTALAFPTITGANTFNNLSITGRTSVGASALALSANQTINNTLTVSAGTASAYRTSIVSNTVGTTRTLTCAAVSLTDTDFRDITIAGAASPASGVDSISATQGFAVLVDENASGIDVFTVSASIFNAAFTDSASGIDALQPNFTYFITVSEGVNAQDLIFARYLWELIDNTETSDWGVINDTQTASWSQIDDTQALNWQNVGNTQTATWSQIDDNESGNWEQI